MKSNEKWLPAGLPGLLGVLAFGELVLLRTGTRTLVHIPGLGRYETPIRILAEVGRFAYYLAVVSLVAVLAILAYQGIRTRTPRHVIGGVGALVFLAVAGAGRLEILSAPVVGWASLVLLVTVTATVWRGLRTLPIGFFVLGWAAAGWTVLGQGTMGGLSGRQVDTLMLTAEISLILSAVTAPLLLKGPPSRLAILAGLGVALVGVGAFVSGSSTLSILILWNLGVPGWLPGIAYALALGSLVMTLWSALATGQRLTAIGLVLLIAGGIGTISTYQTGLVLAALLLLGEAMDGTGWEPTETIARSKRTDSLEVMTVPTRAPGLPKTPSPVG
jgi:hypothetical protein